MWALQDGDARYGILLRKALLKKLLGRDKMSLFVVEIFLPNNQTENKCKMELDLKRECKEQQ